MPILTYYHQSYDGGLNDTSSPQEIERDEGSRLENWHIRYKGQLKRRPGLVKKGGNLAGYIYGFDSFVRTNGGKDFLVMDATTLKYLNTATWTSLDTGFTGTKNYCFETVPALDKLYLCNEENILHMWDRAATTENSCLTEYALAPHGNVMKWHKNHMFHLNNVTVGATMYPNRVYWSAMGDPTTYDTVNDFFETPGGGRVLAFAELGNTGVIFKEKSISFLTGWGSDSWAITATASNVANFDEEIGIAGPLAYTNVGDEIWFMDEQGQIRRLYKTDFDAYRRDIISTKIQTTLSGMNRGQISKVSMFTWNDYVFVALPNGTDTYNSIVMVFDVIASKRNGGKEAWEKITGWHPQFFTAYPTSGATDLYWASQQDKKVYYHSGNDDDGVAIAARWDGKDDDYNKPNVWKRYKWGEITGESLDSASVGIYASVDGASFAHISDLDLTPTGSTLGPTGSFLLGPTGTCVLGGNSRSDERYYFDDGGGNPSGKTVMMSIRHAVVGETPTVNTFSNNFKQGKVR